MPKVSSKTYNPVSKAIGFDPSDFVAPIGMAAEGGSKLLQALLKRFKLPPTKQLEPIAKNVDRFGLDPKMDRRGFFRRAVGAPARDAERATDMLDDDGYIDSVLDADDMEWMIGKAAANKHKAQSNVFNKLTDKYWDVDNMNTWGKNDQPLNVAVKNLGKNITSNFTNEVRAGLDDTAKRALDENPEKVGETTGDLLHALMSRFGIRK